ncbi:FAD-dependent oxidoreductase [Prauserella alba]|uniref:N-methyl-L-tryptophan oxidase n=1 Tax=Prauserella alba TaxID=176898 RepID=A0ABP4G1F0_9PSEU|nr:FAD-dependent oxidoreductase [Prauserella alba]
MDAQIAVVGLGSVGSMVLWQASRLSSSVVGFEAAAPAHPRSAVGGDTRLFRMTYRDPHPYYPLLTDAHNLWRELEKDSGDSVLHQHGGLSIGDTNGAYIPALLRSIRRCGATHELLTRTQVAERYPQHTLYDDDIAVFDPYAGFLRTDTAVLAAVRTAQDRGAEVLRNCRVNSIREFGDGVELSDGERSWTFERVIIAGGGWSGELLPSSLRPHLYPARIYLTWFPVQDPAQFTPDRFPIFVRISGDQSLYGTPSLDGSTIKATLDGRSQPADHASTVDRTLTHAETEESRRTVGDFFSGVVPEIVRSDSYPDLYTTDRAPLVGPAPGSSRTFLATGFSGAGFKMAAAFGRVAAEQALDTAPHPEAGFASPDRFASR